MPKVHYKAISFSALSLPEQASYQPLLLPSTHRLIGTSLTPPNALIGVEARLEEGELIGFALAETLFEAKIALIHSWMVKENFREKGVGTHLLHFLQMTLQQLGILGVALEYEQSNPFAPLVEKILHSFHWPSPRLYLIRCHYDNYLSFKPSWYTSYTPPSLPGGMSLFSWKDLTSQERERVAFQLEQGVFLPYLSPFREEEKIDLFTSVGLRFKQEVIGWSITHRIAPDTLRYSILYIDKQYQLSGYALWLLVTSLHLQTEAAVLKAMFEVNVEDTDRTWWHFVLKRLAPSADRVEKWNKAFFAFRN